MLNIFFNNTNNQRSTADINAQVSHNIRCAEALNQYTQDLTIYELNTLVLALNSLQEQIKGGTLKECRIGNRTLVGVGRGIIEFVED